MWQEFTERTRRIIFFAQEEAGKFDLDVVDTEHILLGLVREKDNVACRILDRAGFSLDAIRREVKNQAAHGDKPKSPEMQLTQGGKRVIDLAYEESKQLKNDHIGPEHILLGLLGESEGLAGRVLAKLGVELEKTRAEIEALQDRRQQDAP